MASEELEHEDLGVDLQRGPGAQTWSDPELS